MGGYYGVSLSFGLLLTIDQMSKRVADENPLSPPLLLSSIPHICHLDHQYIGGEKIGHVEKFQISMYDRCGEI